MLSMEREPEMFVVDNQRVIHHIIVFLNANDTDKTKHYHHVASRFGDKCLLIKGAFMAPSVNVYFGDVVKWIVHFVNAQVHDKCVRL